MDHVVRIDGGDEIKEPIVLHLLPGEETIFNLVLINDKEPLDISLLASDPVINVLRFRKQDSHVKGRQIIPIFARMPEDTDRLEGEIILQSRSGESRVPITILQDSVPFERPGRSLPMAQSRRLGRPASRARVREIVPAEEEDAEDRREGGENPDLNGIGLDMIDPIDPDGLDEEGEGRSHDLDGSTDDQDTEFIPVGGGQSEVGEKEDGYISFSKDADLERYRSARRVRRVEDLSGADDYFAADDNISGDDDPDFSHHPRRGQGLQSDWTERIDRGDRNTESLFGQRAGRRAVHGAELGNDELNKQFDPDSISSGEMIEEGIEKGTEEGIEGGIEEGIEEDDFGSAIGAMQIIPAIIFLGLVSTLVLTFITESIPEFPGALVSSILIVTLIIYGAATLLKA